MICNEQMEDLIVGERRWLTYKVTPYNTTTQYFTILSASYEITKLGESVLKGDCSVDNDEKTIKCLINAVEKGEYAITFTWTIADEIYKERVRINIC